MFRIILISFIAGLFASISTFGQDVAFNYVSPMPGAKFVSNQTNLVLKSSQQIDANSITNDVIDVVGSISGAHEAEAILLADGKTIIVKLKTNFTPCETVNITSDGIMRLENGSMFKSLNYSYTVSCRSKAFDKKHGIDQPQGEVISQPENAGIRKALVLPGNFPKVKVNVVNNPDAGYVFVGATNIASRYIMMLNNDGTPFYYQQLPFLRSRDFKKFENGANDFIGYADDIELKYYLLNKQYAKVDSFQAGNGYDMDTHEFERMPNGNALILIYDRQIYDMSQEVAGGNTDCQVTGIIVQEIDSATKNVVFEWRTWDHLLVKDNNEVDLLASLINPFHGNSIDYDPVGDNIYVSFKELNEVTKIDHSDGTVLWRMGGGSQNQFTLKGDTAWYCDQHDARLLPNGNITVYDNGTCHGLAFAKEYEIDETLMEATLVWSYAHPEGEYANTRGNVQRLPNGNTLIGWGGGPALPDDAVNVSEVTPGGTVAYEMVLDSVDKNISYRAYRFEWDGDDVFTNLQSALGLPFAVNVYPNPSNGVFNIGLVGDVIGAAEVVVFDEQGRPIKATSINGDGQIDMTGNAPGIYFVQTSTSFGTTVNRIILTE